MIRVSSSASRSMPLVPGIATPQRTRRRSRRGPPAKPTCTCRFCAWRCRARCSAGALLHNTTVASVWWFGLVYTSMYFVYQIVFGRFVLEMFYYFAHLAVVVFLLVPIIVGELRRAQSQSQARLVAGLGVAGLVVFPLANHLVPGFSGWLQTIGNHDTEALIGVAGLAGILIVGARPMARRGAAPLLLAGFLLLVQALTLFNLVHREVFNSQRRAREAGVYLAAIQMIDVFASATRPKTPVMLWYCGTQRSLTSIASAVLLFTVNNPWVNEPCDARLRDPERGRLASTQPRYVLMMSEQPEGFSLQEASLRHEGYRVDDLLTRTIGDDAYRAGLRLVRITRGTP